MYICVCLFIYIHVCILKSLLALEVGEELIAHRVELRIFFRLLLDLYTTHTHTHTHTVSDAFDCRVLHVKAAECTYTHTNTHAHVTSTPCLRLERFHPNTHLQETFV